MGYNLPDDVTIGMINRASQGDNCGILSHGELNMDGSCDQCVEALHLEDVPTLREGRLHYDGGDIDNHGRWVGGEICCLACHEETFIKTGMTPTYMLVAFYFDCCGENFVLEDRI